MNGMKLPHLIFIVISILIMESTGHAQPRFQAGWNFALSFPQGQLRDRANKLLPGWGIDLNYAPGGGHILPGLSFVYLKYSEDEVRLIADDGVFDLETRNVLLQWHLSLRYRFTRTSVQPYLEALAGFHYLYTETTVSDPESGVLLGGTINHDDLAFSYGGNAGTLVKLIDGHNREPGSFLHNLQLFLDMRARYVRGGRASYYSGEVILPGTGPAELNLCKSATDMLSGQVGLVVAF
jgi:hypothetical protein